ncbi:DUF3040 domain-containing protein [Klenkia sp. PcliD-1-E]|uniref:DUF3040 domain-containing protein n=1 Tax=Klenkia sp. PcliD-1-E TaxID=2954492 RepID=UPI0020969A39|nr:DUF3040 domain-containing protein [Klenkia sp. PcliD-1-E]MCO7220920.1 DUF3040 domain-containing protein [Klenkia sp. PcliD-1-E]
MNASDDGRLAEIAARLSADDPALARRLSPVSTPRNRLRWALGTTGVAAALVLLGVLVGNVALALLAVPVSATAALVVYGRTLRNAWRTADHDPSTRPHEET